MKYICKFDDKVFTDYEDAWDYLMDWFTNEDFINYAKKIDRFDEMIDDLMDHDTDQAQSIPGGATVAFFEENTIFEEEET